MKSKQLFILMLLCLALPLSSFNKKAPGKDTLYCYLRYEVLTKDDTWVLIVSDIITYDDWKDNSLAIRKQFAAKAIEETGIEVWEPSIKDEGLSSSQDEVSIIRAKSLKRFKDHYSNSAGQPHTVKTYIINLYR